MQYRYWIIFSLCSINRNSIYCTAVVYKLNSGETLCDLFASARLFVVSVCSACTLYLWSTFPFLCVTFHYSSLHTWPLSPSPPQNSHTAHACQLSWLVLHSLPLCLLVCLSFVRAHSFLSGSWEST